MKLWIAFIFQYLWDTKQHPTAFASASNSCELLSFFSIFGIQNNCNNIDDIENIVVNCFHFSVSLGYKTTILWFFIKVMLLWIAFIFQYLWDTKQPLTLPYQQTHRCELLSFFSIFGIQNNRIRMEARWCKVVNCFHFSVSLGYKTTLLFFISSNI